MLHTFPQSRRHRLFLLAALFLLPGIPRAQQGPAPPGGNLPVAEGASNTAATSKARQVRIKAEDREVQAAFTNFTDSLLEDFRALMKEQDDSWAFPITVHVSGHADDVVEGATAVIPPNFELLPDGRIDLRLYVRLHNRYDQKEVNRRFIRLLLYEEMTRQYAGHPNAFDEIDLQVPYWLIRGIDELIRHRAAGRPSTLFAGILNSREVLPVAEILRREESDALDPVSDAIFGASAAALVQALLDQAGGADSLRAYLAGLPEGGSTSPGDADALLRKHFPGLRGSTGALEKWWSLQVASMGQLQAFEYYPPEKTEQLLEEALAIHLAAETREKGDGLRKFLPQSKPRQAFDGRLSDFEQFQDHEGAQAALEQCRLSLRALGMKAFPLYQRVVLRYEGAVLSLINGKDRGVAEELEKLDRERQGIRRAMEHVYDYMNYFEATQAEGSSEAYEQYRQMKDKLDREGRPIRKDRITRYLDKLESEFEGQ